MSNVFIYKIYYQKWSYHGTSENLNSLTEIENKRAPSED